LNKFQSHVKKREMMEKKRSVGVIIIALLFFIIGIIGALNVLRDMIKFGQYNLEMFTIFTIFSGFIILSIGLFKLFQWARITVIFISLLCIGFYIYLIISYFNPRFFGHDYSGFELMGIIFYIPGVLLSLVFIYYLTRPQSKRAV